MKLRFFSMLASIVAAGLLGACESEEFKSSEDGFQYKYVKHGEGDLPKQGEIVYYNMMYKNEKDSVLYTSTSERPALVMCDSMQWDNGGPLYKAFKLIKVGDSILIKIPTKKLFDESFKAPVPPSLNAEGEITFCIGATKTMTQQEMQAESVAKSKEQLDKDIEKIDTYLKENNITAQSTESGLRYVLETEGSGENPQPGDSVTVHYTGLLMDGTQFDSSEGKDPLKFVIGRGQVIQGWDEGIALLKSGGKGTLYIPSPLAYGTRGAGGVIPPNSILKFEVELISVNK